MYVFDGVRVDIRFLCGEWRYLQDVGSGGMQSVRYDSKYVFDGLSMEACIV